MKEHHDSMSKAYIEKKRPKRTPNIHKIVPFDPSWKKGGKILKGIRGTSLHKRNDGADDRDLIIAQLRADLLKEKERANAEKKRADQYQRLLKRHGIELPSDCPNDKHTKKKSKRH